MPRANRHFLPGYVWHITHRCHRKSFLLKFARYRQSYLRWVFEAKKRFGLSVLNYIVTCNHVHFLVRDSGPVQAVTPDGTFNSCHSFGPKKLNQRGLSLVNLTPLPLLDGNCLFDVHG
jgi:hypothetical protein